VIVLPLPSVPAEVFGVALDEQPASKTAATVVNAARPASFLFMRRSFRERMLQDATSMVPNGP
jgi:hypothetical protein